MKTSEIIECMLQILNSPSNWKAGNLAVDRSFAPVDPTSTLAVKWSVEGACIKAANGDPSHWLKVKKIILQFRPPLGASGEVVNYLAVITLLMGCYHYAYLQEMSAK